MERPAARRQTCTASSAHTQERRPALAVRTEVAVDAAVQALVNTRSHPAPVHAHSHQSHQEAQASAAGCAPRCSRCSCSCPCTRRPPPRPPPPGSAPPRAAPCTQAAAAVSAYLLGHPWPGSAAAPNSFAACLLGRARPGPGQRPVAGASPWRSRDSAQPRRSKLPRWHRRPTQSRWRDGRGRAPGVAVEGSLLLVAACGAHVAGLLQRARALVLERLQPRARARVAAALPPRGERKRRLLGSLASPGHGRRGAVRELAVGNGRRSAVHLVSRTLADVAAVLALGKAGGGGLDIARAGSSLLISLQCLWLHALYCRALTRSHLDTNVN